MISFFSILILLICAFCISIPQTIRFYFKYQKNKDRNAFSSAMLMGILSIVLVSIAYRMSISMAVEYSSGFTTRWQYDWLVNALPIILTFLVITLVQVSLIPRVLLFFNRWKSTKSPSDFSLMTFFGTTTLFCLSYIILIVFTPG